MEVVDFQQLPFSLNTFLNTFLLFFELHATI
jgi:hypothetical protein